MVGRLGDDIFGPLLEGLRGHGVDVSRVATDPDAPSGVAVILLDARRQNHIVAVYGANTRCDGEQVVATESALDGADALLLQLEVPPEASLAAAQAARRRGVGVIWDPAPAIEMAPEAYASADVLTPNQSEARALTGIEVTNVGSAREAAMALRDLGPKAVVVKMGDQGVYYLSKEAHGHVPAFRVEAVDTIAAGDAFAGALAVSLAKGNDLETSARYGAAAGAIAVTKTGAQEAMPNRSEVQRLVDGH